MEVRRGNKTHFYGESVRTYWPSVAAWKATLPEGGIEAIKEYGSADKYATTNPVLARFLERARAVYGTRVRRRNNIGNGTRESQAREKLAHWRSMSVGYPSHLYGSLGTFYEKQIVIAEEKLAALLESGTGSERLYKDNKTCFFALLPDGDLAGIYYNVEDNMIMYRSDVDKGSHTWIPLTDADMPLWFQTGNNKMIKM